ncbi:MAG: transposase family protein [Bdellovibrionales bacterium]|nr:transposase family protein [Bdellovibrionales bacterium]
MSRPLSREKYPQIIRVDQGTEFTSRAMLDWAYRHGIQLEFTKVRKTNQIVESFNSRVRDECLNEHVFFSRRCSRENRHLALEVQQHQSTFSTRNEISN